LKKLIYEVYGDCIEGLEDDFWDIMEYCGRDFAEPKKKTIPHVIDCQGNQSPVIPLNRIA